MKLSAAEMGPREGSAMMRILNRLQMRGGATALILAMLAFSGVVRAAEIVPATAEAAAPRVETDVVFGHAGGVDLKLDLALPATGEGPFPAIVCSHGGAWQLGHKEGQREFIQMFAKHGYVAAAVEYRLTPGAKFPAQIEDVKCAIRYLRAHAKEYKLNSARFGAAGESAGGHLSLLAGLMDPADGMEGDGGWPGFSSKVQAVVNYFGPSNLATWRAKPAIEPIIKNTYGGKTTDDLLVDLVGTADRAAPEIARLSPVTYINKGDPPVLSFHGELDPLVDVSQSRDLHVALKAAGVTERLVVLPGLSHGWGGENRKKTDAQAVEFFDIHLKDAGDN